MHKALDSIEPYRLDAVVSAFHPSPDKVKGGLEVQGHLGLHSEFVVSLRY